MTSERRKCERHLIICSDWMNIMAGLCPFGGPGHRCEDDGEDTVSTPAKLDSLWCPSVIVHIKVIKRVQVKNYDACSVFISWRWILQSVLAWMGGLWMVHAALAWCLYKKCLYSGLNNLLDTMKITFRGFHRSTEIEMYTFWMYICCY